MRNMLSISIAALVVLICLVAALPPSAQIPVHTGDFLFKYLQITDFIQNDYASLSCNYFGQKLDPNFKFFPYKLWFHTFPKTGECFYSFPWQITVLYTPLFLLFKQYAFYLVSILSATLLLVYCFLLVRHFRKTESFVSNLSYAGLAWVLALVPNYAFTPNEHCLSALLLTATAYHFIQRSLLHYAVAALTLVLCLAVRIEMIVLLPLFTGAFYLQTRKASPEAPPLKGLFIFLGLAGGLTALMLLLNYIWFQNPTGLRGSIYSGNEHQILDRLEWYRDYLFGDKNAVFALNIVFLALFFYRFLPEGYHDLKILLLIAVLGAFAVMNAHPPNILEPQFGRRFLYAVYPLLGVGSVLILVNLLKKRMIHIPILIVLALYSFNLQSRYVRKSIKLARKTYQLESEIQSFIKNDSFIVVKVDSLLGVVAPYLYSRNVFFIEEDQDLHDFLERNRGGIKTLTILNVGKFFRPMMPGLKSKVLLPKASQDWQPLDGLDKRYYEVRRFKNVR